MKRQNGFIGESPKSAWQRGFTVVEMMIVLAVAGLILLVVLLAIPALERSSHNNQRRQDVQQILAAVSHYELNNSGNMPGSPALPTSDLSKLTYYTPLNVSYPRPLNGAPSPPCAPVPSANEPAIIFCISGGWQNTPPQVPLGDGTGAPDIDTVFVYNYQICNSAGDGSTYKGAGYNSVVALYAIQTGSSSTSVKCQQL